MSRPINPRIQRLSSTFNCLVALALAVAPGCTGLVPAMTQGHEHSGHNPCMDRNGKMPGDKGYSPTVRIIGTGSPTISPAEQFNRDYQKLQKTLYPHDVYRLESPIND